MWIDGAVVARTRPGLDRTEQPAEILMQRWVGITVACYGCVEPCHATHRVRALVMCMRTEEIGVDENGGGGGSERDGTVARGLGLCEEEAGT